MEGPWSQQNYFQSQTFLEMLQMIGSHSAVHSSDIFIKLISSPGPPGSNELLTNRIIEINERLHCGWILTALMGWLSLYSPDKAGYWHLYYTAVLSGDKCEGVAASCYRAHTSPVKFRQRNQNMTQTLNRADLFTRWHKIVKSQIPSHHPLRYFSAFLQFWRMKWPAFVQKRDTTQLLNLDCSRSILLSDFWQTQ